MIGETIGNHKITAKLGQGGMGTVYEAEDTTLGRKVAIKVLNPSLTGGKELERFESEAKVQASLNHPNIVTLYQFEPLGNSYYMAMEYVEGRTLSEIVRSCGALPPHIVVSILKQVLDGLAAAHRRGIVHRDLKPSNIMLTPEGIAKVMDFGIAKVQGGKSLTASGALVGTVYYMSPEQVRGETVDSRSDLYSFGIILFELLTGRVPFKDDSEFQIMIHHVQTPPPPPTTLLPNIPQPLEAIVMRCLAKDQNLRYQTADEILAAFEGFEEQERAQGRGPLYTRKVLAAWLAGEKPKPVEQAAAVDGRAVVAPQPPATAQAAVPPQPQIATPAPAPSKKGFVAVAAILAVIVLAGAAGAWYFMTRRTQPVDFAVIAPPAKSEPVQAGTAPAVPVQPAEPAATALPQSVESVAKPEPEPVKPAPATQAPAQSRSVAPPPRPGTANPRTLAAGTPAANPAAPAARQAEPALPQGILIFLDADQSGERLPLGTAQARIAEVVRESGRPVVSSGAVAANVRVALDRRDLAEVRRNGVGYVILGTAHGSLEQQNAYGSTYNVARASVSLEMVRMSDGAVASTGSGDSRSRGSANATAALQEALTTATSDAARALMRDFKP